MHCFDAIQWVIFWQSSPPFLSLILIGQFYNLEADGEVLFRNAESTVMCVCLAIWEGGEPNKEENLISKNSSGARVSSETAACLEHGLFPAPANWSADIRKRVKNTASVCFATNKWPSDWPPSQRPCEDVRCGQRGIWLVPACRPSFRRPAPEKQRGQLLAAFTPP